MAVRTSARPTTPLPLGLLGLAALVALVSVLAVGLVIAGGGYEAPALGLPDPGPIVVWGSPMFRLLTDVAALVTIGWLLSASVLDPAGKNGVVSPAGRQDLVRAGLAACAWAVLALVQMVFALANVLGLTLVEALNPQVIATYANEVPATRALMAVAALALVVAVGCFLSSSTGAAMGWLVTSLLAAAMPALGGHGAGLGDHAMALTSGVAHILGAYLWVGGLLALALHAVCRDMPMQRAVQKFSGIALIAFICIAVSGVANAYTRLDTVNQLFSTGYGQVIIFKLFILVALGVIAWVMRERVTNSLTTSRLSVFARVAALELLTMGVAIALGVALASSAPPRVETQFTSYGESLLGFAYPPSPTLDSVAFGFHLDPLFFVGSLVAAALYIAGVARMRSRGHLWPWGRTISWMLGLVVVIWCTNAGISQYAQVSVGLHMLQHMTLTMLAPILLVLGAPATLALRALRPSHRHERGPREWLVWFLHSWITRILTNPFYVFVVYVLGLYGLYLTPAFGWLMGSHVGHIVMQLHFLLSGYLFYWVVIGIDPRPRPLTYWARLLLLLLALAVHGFFAVILMMSSTPLAYEWYGIVRPPWIPDLLQDSLNGGQVAWALSEIPTLIVMIVISIQWARSDDREAKRNDRQADRDGNTELNAYNDHLARLAERDQRQR